MSDRQRNLWVGGTVLVGLILLGGMILQFGGIAVTPFTSGRSTVTVVTERADGLSVGSGVLYRGMNVGQVQELKLADDLRSVVIVLQLKPEALVPGNVEAHIRGGGLIGGNASISLELLDTLPQGRLNSGAEIRGRLAPMELIPREFTELAVDIKKTSQQFRESGLIQHLDQAVVNISSQATKAGQVMDSVQKLVGDEKMRQDIQAAVSNVRDATLKANKIAEDLGRFSASLDRAGGNIDRLTAEATETVRDARGAIKSAQGSIDGLTRQISDRLTQVATLLDTMNAVARKVEQGKGTAGQMVNDPRLYEAMVDSAKQLNLTLTDLHRLVQQWEQEGVTLKLGK